jgi:hypothetical protein
MGFDEVGPTCRVLSPSGGIDAMLGENVLDSLMADLLPQFCGGTSDAQIEWVTKW